MKNTTQPRTRALLVASIALCMHASAQEQNVLASAGSHFSNATGSIAWTMGELVIDTRTSGNIIITQGFHQPPDDFSTSVSAPTPVADITVYPNPTRDELFVVLGNESLGWRCTLYDAIGKVVIQQPLSMQRSRFELSALANGLYALHVTAAGGQLVRTFQLIIAK